MQRHISQINLVGAIVLAASLSCSEGASAYSGNTHDRLARESYVATDFSSAIEALGVEDRRFPNAFGQFSTVEDLMAFGARFEDGCKEIGDTECSGEDEYPNGNTPLDHFYDPQQGGKGLTLPEWCFADIPSSADWALEDSGQIGSLTHCGLKVTPQRYSYFDAVSYYKEALVSRDIAKRRFSAGRTFQVFGHLAHHLHDMGQPQHVRDDMHCPETICAFAGRYEPSLLEEIGNDETLIESCIAPWVKNRRTIYSRLPTYGNFGPRKFWSTGDGRGMAEFTNWNFTSVDTNLLGPLTDPEPSDPGKHALPDPDFASAEWDEKNRNSDPARQHLSPERLGRIPRA